MTEKKVKSRTNSTSIAIIGIGCRFPGASNPTEYWNLLCSGQSSVTTLPAERLQLFRNQSEYRFGGFLSDYDQFDARFFKKSPRESDLMDPQQRIALEVATEALFDSGYTAERLASAKAGVFVGAHHNEYFYIGASDNSQADVLMNTGGSRSGIANKISYAWNLRGPSLVIDTDRSSSLAAVHLAYESLRTGEVDLAIAGAANLILKPDLTNGFFRAAMLSPDGKCKFGDASANGFVRSEGVGFVVLKKLEDAIDDGDNIYAVIEAAVLLHDGSTSTDPMTPSKEGQKTLLRTALLQANIQTSEVDYVEAHGTGTPVGDKVELSAIGEVYTADRSPAAPLLIGSVKTNIGHCESAAGIAGIIKVALAMKKRKLPASLNFEKPSPDVDLVKMNLKVNTELSSWPKTNGRLVAGISSFGLSGANAHVVMRSPEIRKIETKSSNTDTPQLLILSSRHFAGIQETAKRHIEFLKNNELEGSLHDYCSTAANKRNHEPWRLSAVGHDASSLCRALTDLLSGEDCREAHSTKRLVTKKPKVVFVYPGQGGQWVGMGRSLYNSEPAFKAKIDQCDKIIRELAGWSLTEELFASDDRSQMTKLDVIQLTLTSIYIAITELWKSWNVLPDAVMGTSMGEVAAAHVAGILSLKDALKITYHRTTLMKRTSGKGAMAVIDLPVDEVREIIEAHGDKVSIAIVNTKDSTVISGDTKIVNSLITDLEARKINCKQIKVDVASHSPQMDLISKDLAQILSDIRPQDGTLPMFSTVTGNFLDGHKMTAEYWSKNLRQPVLFYDTLRTVLNSHCDVIVECSPHPVLWSPILNTIREIASDAIVLPSLLRDKNERSEILSTLGALYTAGVEVKWSKVYPDGKTISLPSPYWQHERYWYKNEVNTVTQSPAPRAVTVGAILGNQAAPTADSNKSPQQFLTKLHLANSKRERENLLIDFIQARAAKVLQLRESDRPAINIPFREMGLNSVMAIELRNILGSALKVNLPSSLLFNYPNIKALAEYLVDFDGAQKPNLGNILVNAGVVTPQQVSEAADVQKEEKFKDKIGTILVKKGYISPNQLAHAINIQAREPIAVIGMACRFPGAQDPEAFWRLINNGTDTVTEVPSSRWDLTKFYSPDPSAPGKMSTKWGAFIDNPEMFDAGYFGISRREAEKMDPQQRLLLEVTIEALERACQPIDKLRGSKTSVFIGVMNTNDYAFLKRPLENGESIEGFDSTGNANSIAAGRISYFLGLQSPAVTIDTACSSSLVATHLACQSLRTGESSMAIVGGVNLILAPETTLAYAKNRMMSKTGRCRTFDASADGYVRGEGCGIVVLKKLADAQADGDPILAVISGSAVNQDGRSSGLTSPNGLAQKNLYRTALTNAGYEASKVSYIEAHGTGTPIGDPIEMASLKQVYGAERDENNPLFIGSVKTNIGHLEAAAGVAGLIKVILSIKHQKIPPHLHFKKLNPEITNENTPIVIPIDSLPWQTGGEQRIAAVSSFGFSGTNAHVLVEEAPPKLLSMSKSEWQQKLVLLSAKSPKALNDLVRRHIDYMSENDEVTLTNFAYTTMASRDHFSYRVAFTDNALHSLNRQLSEFSNNHTSAAAMSGRVSATKTPKIAFFFSDFNFSYPSIATKLCAAHPVFKSALGECEKAIQNVMHFSLSEKINAKNAIPLSEAQKLGVCFAVQYALAKMWDSWKVHPDLTIAEGLGHIAAACLADVFDMKTAITILKHAADLEDSLPELKKYLSEVNFRKPSQRIVSQTTGLPIESNEDNSSEYWELLLTKNRKGVSPSEISQAEKINILVPFGSTQGLDFQNKEVLVLPMLDSSKDDTEVILNALSIMYVHGVSVDWQDVGKTIGGQKIVIPTYAFEREKYWLSSTNQTLVNDSGWITRDPETNCVETENGEYIFQVDVSSNMPHYFADHKVHGKIVAPAVFYLNWALSASSIFKSKNNVLKDVIIPEAMVIEDDETRTVQLVFKMTKQGEASFKIRSRIRESDRNQSANEWKTHIIGTVMLGGAGLSLVIPEQSRFISHLKLNFEQNMTGTEIYKSLQENGINFGPCFQTVKQLYRYGNKIAALLSPPARLAIDSRKYALHPCMIDTALHLLALQGPTKDAYIPMTLDSFTVYGSPTAEYWCEIEIQAQPSSSLITGNFKFIEQSGKVICEGRGLTLKRAERLSIAKVDSKENVDAFFRVGWNEVKTVPNEKVDFQDVLIVSDKSGLSKRVVEHLQRIGHTCQVINPYANQSLIAHVSEFLSSPAAHKKILFLMSVDGYVARSAEAKIQIWQDIQINKAIFDTFKSVIQSREIPIWAVTRKSTNVFNDERASLSPTSLKGFFASLALEHPNAVGGVIDLDENPTDGDLKILCSYLVSDRKGTELAIRSEKVYQASLEEIKMKNLTKRTLSFSEHGSYVVSGGAGGLGQVAIQLLAKCGAKNIVSLSRSGRPVDGDVISMELGRLGAKIEFMACDTSNYAQIQLAISKIKENGPIKGVIHAAGATADGLFLNLTWDDFLNVYQSKVVGAIALNELTLSDQREFFVVYSSAASLLGLPGQTNYSAANAFLDSFAEFLRTQGIRGLSINWGTWSQAGMWKKMTDKGSSRDAWTDLGIRPLSNHEGSTALEQLLFSNQSQAAVFKVDWATFARANRSDSRTRLVSGFVSSSNIENTNPKPVQKSPSPAQPSARTAEKVEAVIRLELNGILKAAPDHVFPSDSPFLEFGLDSVLAVEFRNRLNEKFNFSFPATLAFTYPTIETLTQFVIAEVGSKNAAVEAPIAPQPLEAKSDDNVNAKNVGHVVQLLEQLSENEAFERLMQMKQRKVV